MSATPPDPVPLGAPATAAPEAARPTWRQRIGQALRSLAGRLTLFTPGLARSAWELDREAVLSQISGPLGAKPVGMVELTLAAGSPKPSARCSLGGSCRPWRPSGQ